MHGGEQRLGDVLIAAAAHGFLSATRRLRAGAALAAALAVVGCGGDNATDPSTIARAVAPADLPSRADLPAAPTDRAAARERRIARSRAAAMAAQANREVQRPRAAATTAAGAILSEDDRASFARLAASLGGGHGIAVSALGLGQQVQQAGSIRSGVAWSTSKVPVAMALIATGGAARHQDTLTQAITASSNDAAEAIWAVLGGGGAAAAAADEQLRAAGDETTLIEARSLRAGYTPFGQTTWTLADQVRFTAGMACSAAGAHVLGLMGAVVAEQRWGLGAAGVPNQFKGGWGPGSEPGVAGGYFDRQMGVVTIDGRPLAVAVASRPADGSHETGAANLTAIARWLVENADVSALPARARC